MKDYDNVDSDNVLLFSICYRRDHSSATVKPLIRRLTVNAVGPYIALAYTTKTL